jgi:hypothetical protein
MILADANCEIRREAEILHQEQVCNGKAFVVIFVNPDISI